jgi:hypothetical protein
MVKWKAVMTVNKKKTMNYTLLALILTANCFVTTPLSFGSSAILPSFDSIFRQREVQSKERLLKKLTDNYESASSPSNKPITTKGGYRQQYDKTPMPSVAGDSLSSINRNSYEPVIKEKSRKLNIPVSNSIPVFIPYKAIDTTVDDGFCFVPEKLITMLKGQEKPEIPETPAPAVKMGLIKSSYKVFIEPGDVARIEGELEVEVYEKGYLILPVEINTYTGCTSLIVDGTAARTVFDRNNLSQNQYRTNPRVVLTGPGKHKIEFSNFSTVTSNGNDQWSLAFHIPESISSELITNLPGKNLHVEIANASALEPIIEDEQKDKNRTINRCYLEPAAMITMKWYKETNKRTLDATLPTLTAMGTVQKIEKKPVVQCSVFNRTTFNDGLLSLNAIFRYTVTQAEIDVLTLHVPSTIELLSIKGPSGKELKTWNIDGETVTVFLPSQRMSVIQLEAYGQSFLLNEMKDLGTSKELSLSLPFMTALNTVSSTCFIGLKLGKSLSPDFAESQQFTNITPQDLPSWLPEGQQRGLTCFKAMTGKPEEGPSMTIIQESLSFPDSFRITRAEVATILTKESISQTKALFTIINSRKQFLPVRLPKGSTFQSLYVDSSPAKAGLADSSNKEKILIPLIKSPLDGQSKPMPFTIELVFSTPISTLGSFGTLQLEAMATDEIIDKLQWKVSYPPQLIFTRNDGSLEEAEVTDYGRQIMTRSNGIYKESDRRAARNEMPQSQAAQFIDPQSNVWGAGLSNFASNSNIQSFDNKKQKTEGTLPVRVYLPETGKLLTFEADNVDTKTEFPWLNISYSKNEYVNKFENLLFIFSLLTSVMFLLNLWKKESMKTPSIMLALTVLATGVLYSLFGRSIGTLIQGLVAGLSIIIVYGMFSPLRKWMKKASTLALAFLSLLGLLTTGVHAKTPESATNELKVFIPYESKKLSPVIKRYSNGGFVPRKLI